MGYSAHLVLVTRLLHLETLLSPEAEITSHISHYRLWKCQLFAFPASLTARCGHRNQALPMRSHCPRIQRCQVTGVVWVHFGEGGSCRASPVQCPRQDGPRWCQQFAPCFVLKGSSSTVYRDQLWGVILTSLLITYIRGATTSARGLPVVFVEQGKMFPLCIRNCLLRIKWGDASQSLRGMRCVFNKCLFSQTLGLAIGCFRRNSGPIPQSTSEKWVEFQMKPRVSA